MSILLIISSVVGVGVAAIILYCVNRRRRKSVVPTDTDDKEQVQNPLRSLPSFTGSPGPAPQIESLETRRDDSNVEADAVYPPPSSSKAESHDVAQCDAGSACSARSVSPSDKHVSAVSADAEQQDSDVPFEGEPTQGGVEVIVHKDQPDDVPAEAEANQRGAQVDEGNGPDNKSRFSEFSNL
eukprot:TRINITY_DN7012_c0_g1_i2.p1 TRINITY_DN7012_c0_g1~~TRINITY_DN7012_c0_g1_i2.p1  ORF type:complete len:183 (+),score=13.81 TRINITY_DN7012_c0_g1_i2:83-631(+)